MKGEIVIKNLKTNTHPQMLASFTICIDGEININNCNLIYSQNKKDYFISCPNIKYTSQKTGKQTYFQLVNLSAPLYSAALTAVLKEYKKQTE